jgi:hypothetical protein
VIFLVLPVTTNPITIDFHNASAAGTLLLTRTSGAEAEKWKLSFVVTAGAWELIEAAQLLLV